MDSGDKDNEWKETIYLWTYTCFIHSYKFEDIVKKKVNILQAFLVPIVEELQYLYVHGIDVSDYAYSYKFIDPLLHDPPSRSLMVIRAMLVMFSYTPSRPM